MYYRTFCPLTHRRTRVRCYMTVNFIIWIISMTLTLCYAFALSGFFQLIISKMLVWFLDIICLIVICTTYVPVCWQIDCGKFNHLWRFEKQNFIFVKAFALCAIVYLAIWLPVELLEASDQFTELWDISCNVLLFAKFLKIFCSTVNPVIYFIKLSKFYTLCYFTVKCKERSVYYPDNMAMGTLRSASLLTVGSDLIGNNNNNNNNNNKIILYSAVSITMPKALKIQNKK